MMINNTLCRRMFFSKILENSNENFILCWFLLIQIHLFHEFNPDFWSIKDHNRSKNLIPIQQSRWSSIPDNIQADEAPERSTGLDHRTPPPNWTLYAQMQEYQCQDYVSVLRVIWGSTYCQSVHWSNTRPHVGRARWKSTLLH